MNDFVLDERLENDCIRIADWGSSLLLLMNNALVPWFILVPRTTVTELCDLPVAQRQELQAQVDTLSRLVLDQFAASKMNVAAIGNVVRQLHVHVIGRHPGDYCWPGVVWGNKETAAYPPAQVEQITRLVCEHLQLTHTATEP